MAGFSGCLAGDLGFFLSHEAGVGAALGDQFGDGLLVALFTGVLENDRVVRLEAQPVQALENGVHGGAGRAFAVGVLDTDQELAAGMFGVQPVEQGRARAADMQITGRRGCKTCHDSLRFRCGHGQLTRYLGDDL